MSIFSTILGKIFPGKSASAQTPAPNSTAPDTAAPVDVIALLTGLAAKHKEPLNWKTSIVDLLKLLELDSGLAARKLLAKELIYAGDTSDSATMNIWLHKTVMERLADPQGKIPGR